MANGRIFICADIHGSAYTIEQVIKKIDKPSKNDVIIIAGDAGFEYGDHIMGAAKRAAKKFPGKWIVMRGNHDNCYWDHIKYNNGGWSRSIADNVVFENKYPNILYVNDNGGIYEINGYYFLFLPGAYSVDKHYRLRNGYPYNINEQLDKESMNDLYDYVANWNLDCRPIDFVVAHTAPRKMEPLYSDLFLSSIDQSTVDHRTEQWLDSMADLFEANPYFKQYFFGHFHDTRVLNDKYTMVYQIPINIEKWIGE